MVAHRCGYWLEATELVGRLASTARKGVEREVDGLVGVVSTLLGPEGTRDLWCCFEPQGLSRVHIGRAAHDVGCLSSGKVSGCSLRTTQWMRASLWSSCEEHTVDVLAPGADEGRRRLRKASGSCQPSCDPRVSEWGNPASVMWGHPRLNI